MIVSHIVAVSKNFVIGKNNKLPWRMPSDAQYFHDVTRGHIVIMGRKNYEANKKALPGRLNIVITRRDDFNPEDAVVVDSIDKALEYAENNIDSWNKEIQSFNSNSKAENNPENKDQNNINEVFIVGGGEIYKQTIEIVDRIYITVIDTFVDGDTKYPEIDLNDYTILSKEEHKADNKNPYDYTYYVLKT